MFDWFVSAFYEILLRLTEIHPQSDAGTDLLRRFERPTARSDGLRRHRSRQMGQSRLEMTDSGTFRWDSHD